MESGNVVIQQQQSTSPVTVRPLGNYDSMQYTASKVNFSLLLTNSFSIHLCLLSIIVSCLLPSLQSHLCYPSFLSLSFILRPTSFPSPPPFTCLVLISTCIHQGQVFLTCVEYPSITSSTPTELNNKVTHSLQDNLVSISVCDDHAHASQCGWETPWLSHSALCGVHCHLTWSTVNLKQLILQHSANYGASKQQSLERAVLLYSVHLERK